MINRYHIMKSSSAFYRLSQMYFAERLRPYNLGAGQQFFLDRIGRNPGISMAELAELGTFDCCTVTRAVRRLVEENCVRIETDEKDRRIKRLYPTEKGEGLVEPLAQIRLDWFLKVTEGFTEEEKAQAGVLLGRLEENARACVEEQRRQRGEAEISQEINWKSEI